MLLLTSSGDIFLIIMNTLSAEITAPDDTGGADPECTPAALFADITSRRLHNLIGRIAVNDATVLISGETGSGKEVVAREIHRLSHRRERPFIAVNCGALTGSLIESELFGHEKGAFTGAQRRHKGWFEQADGGTLFLDEIGDLPLAAQVKLLRVLQEQRLVRVGSSQPLSINIRLLAATNVDLHQAVALGRFRSDLFYRLNVFPLQIPPLRQRPGDLSALVPFLLRNANADFGCHTILTAEALRCLQDYHWPGNIRQLENVIRRTVLIIQRGQIKAAAVRDILQQEPPPAAAQTQTTAPLMPAPEPMALRSARPYCRIQQQESAALLEALHLSGGNKTRAAFCLGLTPRQFRYRLEKLGLTS